MCCRRCCLDLQLPWKFVLLVSVIDAVGCSCLHLKPHHVVGDLLRYAWARAAHVQKIIGDDGNAERRTTNLHVAGAGSTWFLSGLMLLLSLMCLVAVSPLQVISGGRSKLEDSCR